MEIKVRERIRPPEMSEKERAYGPFADKVIEGTQYFKDLQDRCTYVAITGHLPSHLRTEYTKLLCLITEDAVFSSLDRLDGSCAVKPWPFKHLNIENHPMYLVARGFVGRGYRVRASRGPGTRRGFSKVFFHKDREGGVFTHQVTINIDGSVKQAW